MEMVGRGAGFFCNSFSPFHECLPLGVVLFLSGLLVQIKDLENVRAI